MRNEIEEFGARAESLALELSEYAARKGYDLCLVGAAGKLLFDAAKHFAMIEMLKDPKAAVEALRELMEEEEVDEVIKEAEGVLRDGD